MRTFSTCRGCGHLLMVAIGEETVNTNVHVDKCTIARPTRRDTLMDDILATEKVIAEANDEANELYGRLEALNDELRKLDGQPPRLLDAAMKYAQWGWPVFPLSPNGKQPAIPKAKGGNGVKDATTDVDRVRKYWTKNPTHNIGLATGFVFDVIDVDVPGKDHEHNGMEALPELLNDKRLPDAHGVAITASGGLHYYIKATGKGNRSGMLPGIDFRGLGGYVVAPPSVWNEYAWPLGRWAWLVAPSPEIHR